MDFNAYIVGWTMNDYDGLKQALVDHGFAFELADGDNIRIKVPYEGVEDFGTLCRSHFNAPPNYVDVQFPALKRTVLIFASETFVVSDDDINKRVKQWAIALGLPTEQADWATSY
jgi:hypothetical protein